MSMPISLNRPFLIVILILISGAVLMTGKPVMQSFASGRNEPEPVLNKSKETVQQDVAEIYRAAELLLKDGRMSEVVSAYEKAIKIAPDMAETYLRLGLVYFKLNLPTKAEGYYLQAVSHGMDNAEVYFHLGYIEEVRGFPAKALEYYSQAEKKGTQNPELFYNIGNIYAGLGKNSEALGYYKKVVSMNAQHMDAFVNLSVV